MGLSFLRIFEIGGLKSKKAKQRIVTPVFAAALCVMAAILAAVLLYAGGLQALQDVMITLSFPFSVIMIFMVISLAKDIHKERIRLGLYLIPPVDADRKEKAEKKG